ncbi:unnamed protein product, partial [Mesorhabditis spiculigera]
MFLRGASFINTLIILTWNSLSIYGNPIDNGLSKSVDLLLILDGSGSVGDETFQNQVAFAMHLAQRLNISEAGSRMGLEWAIQRIPFLSGATNTGQALKFALSKGFDGARGGSVPKVAVVVTDGQSQDDVASPSQLLRDAHVLVYAVGVTNLVNVHQLHQMAGNPQRVFTVESFEQLDKTLADALTWDMCKTEFRIYNSTTEQVYLGPGTPDIICGPDRIGVRASTKKPFDGYVFVMDHFHEEDCRAGPEKFMDPRSIGITVPFSSCNVHRYRSLNPRGIFVEMTVVFMFHSMFMTKVDQMVKIQCFYMESEKTVNVPLSVSMLTTQFREKVYQMPVCTYTLRKGAPDGPIVRYASLGDSVFHRWECLEVEEKDTFGMLVHSCYVDNGYGDKVDVLTENGCGLDAIILETPDYDSSLRLATRPYHVFKYADRPVLQFQCQITLCIKYGGGCDGVTPPVGCPNLTAHLHNHAHAHMHSVRRKRRDNGVGTLDVFTEAVTILEELPNCMTLARPIDMRLIVAVSVGNVLIFLISGLLCILSRRRSIATKL